MYVAQLRGLAALAGAAAAAADAGVDVDAVADLDVGDEVTDLGDDAGGVEAEDSGQLRQREVGEPLGVDGEDVLEVGDDVAGGDLHDDIGGARLGGGDPLELHRVADLVQAGGEHLGHGCLLFRLSGCVEGVVQRPDDWSGCDVVWKRPGTRVVRRGRR